MWGKKKIINDVERVNDVPSMLERSIELVADWKAFGRSWEVGRCVSCI